MQQDDKDKLELIDHVVDKVGDRVEGIVTKKRQYLSDAEAAVKVARINAAVSVMSMEITLGSLDIKADAATFLKSEFAIK